jgi:hypothetical protein
MAALQEVAIGRIRIKRRAGGDQRRNGGAVLALRGAEKQGIAALLAMILRFTR